MRKVFNRHNKQIRIIFIAIVSILISMLFTALTVSGIDSQVSSVAVPQDLIINIGMDASNLNFNWYCDSTVSGTPSIKIANIEKTFIGTQGTADNSMKITR